MGQQTKRAAINIYQLRKTQIRLGKFTPDEVKGKHQNASFGEIIEDRRAVAKALSAPPNSSLRHRVLEKYTWRHAAQATLRGYTMALTSRGAI